MNFEELKAKVKKIGVAKIGNDDFDQNELNIRLVHEEGGGEGEGEHVERVFEHDDNGKLIYFRITGFYSSYEGIDWDTDVEKVKPVLKTITVYE